MVLVLDIARWGSGQDVAFTLLRCTTSKLRVMSRSADSRAPQAQEAASQIMLRYCSEEARGESGYILGVFATKDQVVGTSKDYC